MSIGTCLYQSTDLPLAYGSLSCLLPNSDMGARFSTTPYNIEAGLVSPDVLASRKHAPQKTAGVFPERLACFSQYFPTYRHIPTMREAAMDSSPGLIDVQQAHVEY